MNDNYTEYCNTSQEVPRLPPLIHAIIVFLVANHSYRRRCVCPLPLAGVMCGRSAGAAETKYMQICQHLWLIYKLSSPYLVQKDLPICLRLLPHRPRRYQFFTPLFLYFNLIRWGVGGHTGRNRLRPPSNRRNRLYLTCP